MSPEAGAAVTEWIFTIPHGRIVPEYSTITKKAIVTDVVLITHTHLMDLILLTAAEVKPIILCPAAMRKVN